MPRRSTPERICVPFTDAATFWDRGVCTYPIIPPTQLARGRDKLRAAMNASPECRSAARLLVLGGFAAMGHPTSFHHKTVRALRRHCYKKAKAHVLKPLQTFSGIGYRVECLFDRLMIRKAGQQPDAETFHRDVSMSDHIHRDDLIFGGWVNLDDTPQAFRCVPGTHRDMSVCELQDGVKKQQGFAKCPQDMLASYDARVKHMVIPPGHGIIFFQHIIHDVFRRKAPHDMYRLFTGYRLTVTDKPLYDRTNVFEHLAVPRLPSGQKPPMYSRNHGSVFLFKTFQAAPGVVVHGTSAWSQETFQPCVLTRKRTGPTSKTPGRDYHMVPRYFDYPLCALGSFDFAPTYDASERAMHEPHVF